MRSLQWDIFCKVIDNFGDIGVCWRLAADLAARGQRVRLWANDASALAWMAPGGCAGVQVLAWTEPIDAAALTAALSSTPGDVLVEGFGCDIAPEFIAACTRINWATGDIDNKVPLLINLEYLSAEPYVERHHGLTSLVSTGPAAGWRKVFYYPGFSSATGGLLREPDLTSRQAMFDRSAWLAQHGGAWQPGREIVVSLFCYEPPALAQLVADLSRNGINGLPVRLLVAAGRATHCVKAVMAATGLARHANDTLTDVNTDTISLQPNKHVREQLSILYLPQLTQLDFDHLLWASDINFVRGEDSLVRAVWAGKPFVWQIYPQGDGAHGPKLEAFLDMLAAPASLRSFYRVWNNLAAAKLPPLAHPRDWAQTAANTRQRLARQPDLTSGLVEYALKNR